MFTSKKKLQKSIELGAELAKIQDIDILLDKVLTMSMELVDADAGSIYTAVEGTLNFCNAKNITLQANLPQGKKLIYSTFTIPIVAAQRRHSARGGQMGGQRPATQRRDGLRSDDAQCGRRAAAGHIATTRDTHRRPPLALQPPARVS